MMDFIIRYFETVGVLFSRPFGWMIIAVFALMGLGAYAELKHSRRRTNRRCKKIKEGLR